MKFATKAAARAMRQRRRVRIRLTIAELCAALFVVGLIVTLIDNVQSNLSSNTPIPSTHITTNIPSPSENTINFEPSSNSATNSSFPTRPEASSDSTVNSSGSENESVIPATKVPPKPLAFSPSTITVYKNTDGALGVKSGVLTTSVEISAADGQAIEEPYLSTANGFVLSSNVSGASIEWSMGTTAQYAPPGQYTLNIEASGVGNVVFAGTLQVNVVSLPAFRLTASDIFAQVQRGSTDTADFSTLSYDADAGTPTPSLTVLTLSGPTVNCSSGLSYNPSTVICNDSVISSLSDGTVEMEFTFQNQYQLITIGGGLIVSN